MNATHPTPYRDLNAVLLEFVTSVQAILGHNFIAAYLHGSFAVGDFDTDSDVDFLVVIEDDASAAQVSALQAMHARIYDLDFQWAKHLEGSYIPKGVLRRYNPASEPLLYLDNGSRELVRSSHNNTMVVRWVVREHGIMLAGPDPRSLIDPVSAHDLRQEAVSTMREWAELILANPERINNRRYQPFVVLSYCRMLHMLHTGTVGSKSSAAKWAKGALDSRWAGLIQRAWDDRPNSSLKVQQKTDPDDFKSTLEFIQYALAIGRQV